MVETITLYNNDFNSTVVPTTVSERNCTLNVLQIILAVCYCIVFIIGICGNTLVLLVFRGQWRKGPTIELLILYLAIFDLLASFFGPTVFFYWIVTCHNQWHFGRIGCKVLPTLCRVFTDISIGVILIMAIDRCRVIVTPMKKRFSRGMIHASVALCVFMSVIWESYYIKALVLDETGCNPITVSEPTYSYPLVCLTAIRDVAFITIFTATTIAVYMRLSNSAMMILLQNSQQKSRARSAKVMKMLVVMAVTFAIAVIPRDILHLAYTLSWINGKDGIPHTATLLIANDIAKILQVSNSIYNVFIYGKMHDQFWTVVKLVLTCQNKPSFIYSVKTTRNNSNTTRNNSSHYVRSSSRLSMLNESKKGLISSQSSYTMKTISRETDGSTCSDEI